MEWEWFKPAMLGDFLSTKTRLADVYIKPISIDPKAFWIVLEMQISNQHGDSICIVRNILLCHRSPEEVANSIA